MTPEQRKGWIEKMRKTQAEPGPIHYYGAFLGVNMVGGARYHDFEMNVHGAIVKVGASRMSSSTYSTKRNTSPRR